MNNERNRETQKQDAASNKQPYKLVIKILNPQRTGKKFSKFLKKLGLSWGPKIFITYARMHCLAFSHTYIQVKHHFNLSFF